MTATRPDQDSHPDLDLCLLGPMDVSVDGEPVSVGGPRQMAVLARLMLTPDQMVTMGQLVESVWDGDEPNQPHIAIRSYISNLRRAIEPNRRRRAADSCLASAPPGYRLAIDPASVDWVRFEAYVADGRKELSSGQYAAAVHRIRKAIDLWRGEPCSGLPESHTFLAHRGRLTKLRESAVELLFEALLLQGDHGAVAAEVEAAIDENPLRERLTELGMVAFYRAGRQSEALRLGQLLRSRLIEELGISPSPAIETMELKILNHDQSLAPSVEPPVMPTARTGDDAEPTRPIADIGALPTSVSRAERLPGPTDAPSSTARPNPSATGRRHADAAPRPVGPKRAEALARWSRDNDGRGRSDQEGPEASAAPPPSPPKPPNIDLLASPPTPFGRRTELELLESIGERLAAGAAATAIITGEQGIGKTTLVRSVAARLADQGAVVAWARSVPDNTAPLWSIAQAVLSLLERGEGEPRFEPTPDLMPLAGLGPSVSGALAVGSGADIEYDHAEVMLAVTRLIKRLADRQPVVLIFEDLQWADPHAISVLHYAASSLSDLPVGFVLTWRETDLDSTPVGRNLRELSRLHHLIRVEMEGLEDDAVVELANAIGRPLSAQETELVHDRCDGNPLFIKEVLADPDLAPASGRRRSTLIDVVLDRVERLHDEARSVLAAAALSRRPFTVDFLTSLCGRGSDIVQLVLNHAVRGGVLDEVDKPGGAFRFHHPVVAEVLASELLSVDRSALHRSAGHRLLVDDGPSSEVAHHLSKSPAPADRLLAARIALDLLADDMPEPVALLEADTYVAEADQVLADYQELKAGPWRDALIIDIGCYQSWRAWIDGKPDVWEQQARNALSWALETVEHPGRDRGDHDEVDLDRHLGAAAMTLAGNPPYPVGPIRTGAFSPMTPEVEDLLERAVERLGTDRMARWIVQIRLQSRAAEGKPGRSNQRKALREATKLITGAKRRLEPQELAVLMRVLLSEFHEAMEPAARLSMLEEILELDPGFSSRILQVRIGYPAMLELGRSFEAEMLARKLLDEAIEAGAGLFEMTEARILMVRHLLWTGQLRVADDLATESLDRWAEAGFAEPVPLIRQRRIARLLRREPLTPGHGPDEHHQLLAERSTSPELAFRLARLGDSTRADQCLDRVLESIAVRQLSLSDQALLAMAARLTGHEKAALTVLDMLKQAGTQPVARGDGSVVFGPAALYASLAARAAGRSGEAERLLEEATAAVHRHGGSPASLDVVTSGLHGPQDSNRPPTNS